MDFAVAHIFGIIAMFVIVVKTIGESRNQKEEVTRVIDTPPIEENPLTRIQHYKFAHVVLKDIFFDNPDNFIQNYLSSENALKSYWYDVGKYYSESFEGAEELDGSDIKITAKEIEDTLFVVISLPEPQDVPEAYFIGLIITQKNKEKSRYITLELGEKGSVLCEWTKESHLNFGEGPEATLENFQNKLITMGDVSAKSWNDSKPIYTGEEWMKTLWEWADSYEVSPLVLPRNSVDLKALKVLLLEFDEDSKPTYLPKEIGKLSNLHTFIMYNSEIKELPNEFSSLSNLIYLNLSGNKLEQLPDSFCTLRKLEKVSLSSNDLISLPNCIGELQNLDYLDLRWNLLTELPESMSNLKLTELRLLNNPVEHISDEVQSFLNTTRKKDASKVEPFKMICMFSKETHAFAKGLGMNDFDSSLPFFISGEEVEKETYPLAHRHLLLGILYGLNFVDECPVDVDENVLVELLNILREGYDYESLEEMIIDVSINVRKVNGTTPSRVMLEAGHRLVPESSIIIEHLILDLWAEFSLSDDANITMLDEILYRVEEISLPELHPYSKQLVCYYGLCALIFMSRMSGEEYLEDDRVDIYLKNIFYPNVTDKLLLEKAVALMKEPNKYEAIDMMSPTV